MCFDFRGARHGHEMSAKETRIEKMNEKVIDAIKKSKKKKKKRKAKQ